MGLGEVYFCLGIGLVWPGGLRLSGRQVLCRRPFIQTTETVFGWSLQTLLVVCL